MPGTHNADNITAASEIRTAPMIQSPREASVPAYVRRRKARGQAMVIIALSMIALVAVVALAIDGGSMFNQRRVAQNGVDGSAMAGTRAMLTFYEEMILNTETDDDEWPTAADAAAREDNVRDKIGLYATANGVVASSVEAYFVDQNKNIVSVVQGEERGQGHCGTAPGLRLCQVGENGLIPWTRQVKGIMVKGQAETGSFFAKVIGWDTVRATANATAYMGVAVSSAYDVNLLPIGFFTTTERLNALEPGTNYTLINGSDVLGSGNWGYINYKGSSPNTNVLRAWMTCGFNPSIIAETWPDWCPAYANVQGAEGPISYFTGWPDGVPIEGPFLGVTLRFGDGIDGWWLSGTTGSKAAACQYFRDIAVGTEYIVPVFDTNDGSTGSGLLYHLARLAKFRISSTEVVCNGPNQRWNIQGVFLNAFAPGSSGWHGNLRHNSLHLIFMGP